MYVHEGSRIHNEAQLENRIEGYSYTNEDGESPDQSLGELPQLYDFRGRKPERGGGNVTDLTALTSHDNVGSRGRITG
jgi:hypothetical protein